MQVTCSSSCILIYQCYFFPNKMCSLVHLKAATLWWFINHDLLNVNIQWRWTHEEWREGNKLFLKQQYYLTYISLTSFAVHMHAYTYIINTSLCEYMKKVFFCSLAHCIILMKKHEKEHCTMMKKNCLFYDHKIILILLNGALRYLSLVFVKWCLHKLWHLYLRFIYSVIPRFSLTDSSSSSMYNIFPRL